MASYWSMEETRRILGVKNNYQVFKRIRENFIDGAIIREGKSYIVSDEWISHYQEKLLQDNLETILWYYHYGNNLINNFRLIILSGKDSEFALNFQNIEIRLSCIKEEDIITDFNISVTNGCFTNFPAIEVQLKELLLNRLMLEYSVKLTTVISGKNDKNDPLKTEEIDPLKTVQNDPPRTV